MKTLLSLFFIVIIFETWILLNKDTFFSRDANTPPENSLHKSAFLDVIDSSGIDARSYSTGAAWFDYDNDGNLDLLITGRQTRLYRNAGGGAFLEVTHSVGISSRAAMSGVWGDYDNDGCGDLFIAGHGSKKTDRLYHNACNGTFTDVTKVAGIKEEFFTGYGAAWGDYDNDGYLDLYIANYGKPISNTEFLSEPNILYHNNRNGTFTETTVKAGVSGATQCGIISPWEIHNKVIGGPYKESYQPVWFDYNNDGLIDLFIATDSAVSPLYKNNGNGTFTEVTEEAGLCKLGTGMGVTVGDFDNDEDLDIYVTNTGANYLWQNNADGTFSEQAAEKNVADHLSIGWGTSFFDYDNDGDLDLYVVNGTVRATITGNEDLGKVRVDKLYENNGGVFTEVSREEGIVGDDAKEGGAFGDYNNDGFTDIFVVSSIRFPESRDRFYQNRGNENNWLKIILKGTKSNRDSIGARIRLTASGKTQIREVVSGSSFISQNSLWQTFGLGKAKIIDDIEIRWPSGIEKTFNNIKANRKLVITEGN